MELGNGEAYLQGNLLLELEKEQGFCPTEEVLESGEPTA